MIDAVIALLDMHGVKMLCPPCMNFISVSPVCHTIIYIRYFSRRCPESGHVSVSSEGIRLAESILHLQGYWVKTHRLDPSECFQGDDAAADDGCSGWWKREERGPEGAMEGGEGRSRKIMRTP